MKKIKYLPVLCALFAGNAFADSKWGLGLGAVMNDEGYTNISSETNMIPVIFYQSEDFFLLGPRFGYELASFDDVELSFVGNLRFDGYEESDGLIFKGMDKRSPTIDLGFQAEYDTNVGEFTFELVTDALGKHKGYQASITYSVPFTLDSGTISPYVSFTHYSDKIVDYYYGVEAHEATADRAYFEGSSTTNYEVGVQSEWMFGDSHMFVARASYNRLGSAIKDSPLVDSANNIQFILGYVYVF